MKRRAEAVGGKLLLNSERGGGSRVVFTVDFPG
jgi:signal transduction histidine kinase